MSDIVDVHDIGAKLRPNNAVDPQVLNSTAATVGAGGSTVTGNVINRFATQGLYRSAVLETPYKYVRSSNKKATLTRTVQHSKDNSSWADYTTAMATVIGTTSTTASTLRGCLKDKIDLGSAHRYLRTKLKTAMSTAAGNSIANACVLNFGGADLSTG